MVPYQSFLNKSANTLKKTPYITRWLLVKRLNSSQLPNQSLTWNSWPNPLKKSKLNAEIKDTWA